MGLEAQMLKARKKTHGRKWCDRSRSRCRRASIRFAIMTIKGKCENGDEVLGSSFSGRIVMLRH